MPDESTSVNPRAAAGPELELSKPVKSGRRRLRVILALLFFIVLLEVPQLFGETTYFTSSIANLVFRNNFHTVVPDRLYRSAQMSDSDLEATIKKYGIKSVIDLRLDHATQAGAVGEAGAKLFSVPLAGSRFPSKDELRELIQTFDQAETPVLVHCSSGSHRSAFASAMWLMYEEGKDPQVAQAQFNWRAGYFAIERQFRSWMSGKQTIDQFIPQIVQNNKLSTEDFRTFIKRYVAVSDPVASAVPPAGAANSPGK